MESGPTFQAYYGQVERIVLSEILSKEDPSYLFQVDFDEYLDYLVSRVEWQPLEWDEGGKTIEAFTVQVERRHDFFEHTYFVDQPRLRLRIPISPHPQRDLYFKHEPSTSWLGRGEPDWRFEGDLLIHEVEATEQALQKGIDDVRFWLGNRNKDIEEGNKTLRQRLRSVWEAKRKQLEEQHGATQSLLQKLNIPLYQDPNARAKPVEIRPRQLRTIIEKPQARVSGTPEPMLKREDVVALVDFIERYARQFEVTPRTFAKMGEEELRDLLIGMMNANYPGSTTGETFSKLGKTDISLRVGSGNVLVCECKFWSGAKAYEEALDQLFDYLTWRQNYGVLIHFCNLKDMTRAITEAKRAISEHPSFRTDTVHGQSETRFSSRHAHPQDASKSLEVHHLFVDLSV
jgi:hypothetical protein